MKRHVASLSCVASLSLLMAASSANALELTSETYFVASIGQASIRETPMQVDNNNLFKHSVWNITNLQSAQSSSGGAYKLQLGYEFTPNLAIEGGYVDLGKTTYTSTYNSNFTFVLPLPFLVIGGESDPVRGTSTRISKISGWNVSGVGTYRLNDRFSAFAKLGVIHAEIRSQDGGNGFGYANNAADTRWRPTYGVGATYKYNKTFGVRAEFEKFDKLGDEQWTGSTDVNLMSVGVTAKF